MTSYSQVFSRFSTLGFNVSKEWLNACIEYCLSQDPALSPQALTNAAIEQWMNADITVEGTQASAQIKLNLSPEVAKGPILQGKFFVQVRLPKSFCLRYIVLMQARSVRPKYFKLKNQYFSVGKIDH
jgi:hypothetical protein